MGRLELQGKALLAAAVAAVILGGGIAIALAHTTEYETSFADFTTVQGTPNGGGFKAEIESQRGGCVPDRLVRVFRTSDSEVMGSDRTSGAGKAKILFPDGLALNTYHLSVKRSQLPKPGHHHSCGKVETEPTTFQFGPVP